MFQLLAYIKFLLTSTNQHGVHSPFVYELLMKCFYKKEKKPALENILAYREALLNDHREIEVKDFGAGSRVFRSNKRKVSAIAKNAGISKKRAILLNKLCSYFKIKSALELGTSVGISSAAIAAGNDLQLITLEGCPETAGLAKEYFEKFDLNNIQVNVGSFDLFFSGEWKVESGKSDRESPPAPEGGSPPAPNGGVKPINQKQQTTNNKPQTTENRERKTENETNLQPTTYNLQPTTNNLQPPTYNLQPTTNNLQPTTDLVFFDGNHQKEATLRYFNQLLPLAHNESVFIFDDIHWSKGMEEAWKEIRRHPEVRVTIDTFFWGIVFFRKEQEKEHFTIRL